MRITARRVEYFHTTVKDRPGEAYQVLAMLASNKVAMHAFSITPIGPAQTHLVLFPEDPQALFRLAGKSGLVLSEPQEALLIQGDDVVGALVDAHRKLFDAGINVFAANGTTSGRGGFGHLIFVRPSDIEQAASVIGAVPV